MTHITKLTIQTAIVLIFSLGITSNALTNPINANLAQQLQPQLTHLSHKTVELDWYTPAKTRAVIEFGVNANALDRAALIHKPHTHHQLTLTDLEPNTSYFYRIRINDLSGELISVSNIHHFTTKSFKQTTHESD